MKAVRTTLLIFYWCIPCLTILWLLNLFYFNRFFETPILSPRAPLDYPYSFAIATFVSLCCSAIAIWVYQERRSNFNPLIICLGAFIGFLGNVLIITKVDNYNRSIGIAFFFVLATTLLSVLIFLILGFFIASVPKKTKGYLLRSSLETASKISLALLIYLFPFAIIFGLTIFLACQFPAQKTPSFSQRLLYGSPLLATILIPYFLLINTSFPPGTIIPANIRHEWGLRNFSYTYEGESNRLEACKLITDYIGDVKTTALVEDNNALYRSLSPSDSYSMFTLELIGTKGIAIAKVCSSTRCPRTNFIGIIKSKSGSQEIDISPCLNLN
ncbi:hypothetical protein NIES593_19785 [Hydrococcus rivularis NIES-593]|uniref:Uncharacterized protein n=1 Tax=Hydrococcus rivularis NIES-593 TaxID=1921803 RepID=A0A1U7H9C9_9CYAN|nr:hypothetical protein [Hydrococcus rivularis]OKH20135.1 hypothetical protein NIES593_19785 [Hydrococcus rivularis NIES-593]